MVCALLHHEAISLGRCWLVIITVKGDSTMQARLEQRLADLKAEYQAGQKMLADLEARQTEVQQTMLRISGAIQVLEELLAQPSTNGSEPIGGATGVQAT